MCQRATLEMDEGNQLRGTLFVFIPSSEQKSAPQLARMLLDIGQIDGVMFHQKLDCRPKDQERRNVDSEHLKGFHGNLRGDCRLGHYHSLLGRGGLSTALMPTVVVEVMRVTLAGTEGWRSLRNRSHGSF